MSELEHWLRTFILKFRKEAKLLSNEERDELTNLDDFFEPCQILAIQYRGLTQQFMLVLHNSNRPDLEIDVYIVNAYEAMEKIGPIINDPKWDRSLNEEEKTKVWNARNYRELIERFLIGIIRMRNSILELRPGKPSDSAKIQMLSRDFEWLTHNLETIDPDEAVSKIINEAKEGAERKKKEVTQSGEKTGILIIEPEDEKEDIKGYGTYFYPPIWVGEYPEYTFQERVQGRLVFPNKVLDTTYDGKLLIIYNNGYIGIAENDKQTAQNNLNEIMATGLLLGIPFFAINNYELSEVTFNLEQVDFKIRGLTQRGALSRAFEPQNVISEWFIKPFVSIQIEGMEKIIKATNEITSDPDIKTFLPLFIESYTCFQHSQYLQSFILGWTVIEKRLNFLWESYLIKKNVSKNRIRKFTGAEWSINQVIEMLNVEQYISNEECLVLHDLRRKRNNLVHEGEDVDKKDAEKCMVVARGYVEDRTKIYDYFTIEELKKYITQIFDPREF